MKLKKGDLIIIAFVLLAAAILLADRHMPAAAGGRLLRIELDGQLVNEISFEADTVKHVVVQMPAGEATVVIAEGRVRIQEMPRAICPLGLCSSVGWVERSGEAIVCLPNRLVLTVLGGPVDELRQSLDAITE
ncbi:MAG: hypothetical protein DDT21_01683 [Syntrophomonadaceae bacterium]|nr:hypothetical protein [Bacillota bacterium]